MNRFEKADRAPMGFIQLVVDFRKTQLPAKP
jgi:hypothetical protein